MRNAAGGSDGVNVIVYSGKNYPMEWRQLGWVFWCAPITHNMFSGLHISYLKLYPIRVYEPDKGHKTPEYELIGYGRIHSVNLCIIIKGKWIVEDLSLQFKEQGWGDLHTKLMGDKRIQKIEETDLKTRVLIQFVMEISDTPEPVAKRVLEDAPMPPPKRSHKAPTKALKNAPPAAPLAPLPPPSPPPPPPPPQVPTMELRQRQDDKELKYVQMLQMCIKKCSLNVQSGMDCTDANCNLGAGCGNRVMLQPCASHFKKVPQPSMGYGLMTTKELQAGEILLRYRGEIVDIKARPKSAYLMRLNNKHCIDAKGSKCMAKYINHSCDPNCVARPRLVGQERCIAIVARKDIRAGAFLSLDYQMEGGNTFKCKCCSRNCKNNKSK
jgi:SET domain